MLSELLPKPPKLKLKPLPLPRWLLKKKLRLKPPQLLFKKAFNKQSMISSKNKHKKMLEKKKRLERLKKRKKKKDLMESENSTRNKRRKSLNLLKK